MPKKARDSARNKAKPVGFSVSLDPTTLEFIKSQSDDGGISSGLRGCVRVAEQFKFDAGRLNAKYLVHLAENDPNRYAAYMAKHVPPTPVATDIPGHLTMIHQIDDRDEGP